LSEIALIHSFKISLQKKKVVGKVSARLITSAGHMTFPLTTRDSSCGLKLFSVWQLMLSTLPYETLICLCLDSYLAYKKYLAQ